MLKRLASLHGSNVSATDGDVGTVARFMIDVNRWAVRYIVVATGNWWSGHEVLISPWSIAPGTVPGDDVSLSLTRSQVQNSPPYDPAQALTREHENALLGYYGYPVYWAGPMLWGPVPAATTGAVPDIGVMPPDSSTADPPSERDVMESEVSGLADSRQILGTHLHATDGEIGHVDDFLLDFDDWRIRYLLVDTDNFWIGKRVLVAPEWIESFDWPDHMLHVQLDRESIRTSPDYDPDGPLTREDELALFRHYHKGPYWRD